MFRLSIVIAVALIALAGLLLYVKAQHRNLKPESEWAVGFAADFTSKDASDQSKNCVGKMYVNALQEPRGMRRETECGGQRRIYIWRQDGLVALLDPDKKVYWKPEVKSRLMMALPEEGSSRSLIARETLAGRIVDHYAVTRKQDDGSEIRSEVWEDPRLHSSVRITSPTSSYELTNIKEGAQPEVLFTIPSDYREVPPQKEGLV